MMKRSSKNQVLCGPVSLYDSRSKDLSMGLTMRIRHVLDYSGDFWIKARAQTLVNSTKQQVTVLYSVTSCTMRLL